VRNKDIASPFFV